METINAVLRVHKYWCDVVSAARITFMATSISKIYDIIKRTCPDLVSVHVQYRTLYSVQCCYYFNSGLYWHNYCKMLNTIKMTLISSSSYNLRWRSILLKLEKSLINSVQCVAHTKINIFQIVFEVCIQCLIYTIHTLFKRFNIED